MRVRAGAAAMLAAVLVGGGTVASAAGPGDPPAATTSATTSGTAFGTAATPSGTPGTPISTVTLITGDRVTLTQSGGRAQVIGTEPGEGREGVGFLHQMENGRLYVIPTDVAGLVPDRLDPALFDVAGLADSGYDKSHPGTVPVIVQATATGGAAAKGTRRAASAAPDWADLGIEPERRLESVDAVAADLDRAAASDLLAALKEPAARARTAAAAPSDLKVWLDAPVEALDVDSAPQIGAPAAWEAGYTGEGVTIAVLDGGVDTTHPDLDDVLVGSRDFTGMGSTADHHGHGTHVASIALGSGDASDGVNRGVAPGADLLVGKVLGEDGGAISWVIDGMEWAASEGADIVNMSLGERGNYSDGTDPGSLAVNALSAQYGTLFVISAGNSGEDGNGTVSAPGAADAALTVGAVNDADEVTWFSSRGPRGGDNALKPDVTAPGEEIVAARGAGTAMGTVVDDQHVAASGTSMAAPHVAGAAAVLKQARPELTGQELKAVLMGSAQHTSGTVWDEGAGRIYLPAALDQQVMASPSSLSLGTFLFPQTGAETRTLTYENPTDAEVTLDLAIDVTGPDSEPLPAGAAALSAASVTVPAQGTTTVDVTVDRTTGDFGRFSGAVVATAPGGSETRTALGWVKESEHYELTVEGIGRDGERHDSGSLVHVTNVDDGTRYSEFVELEDGTWTGRVPVGTYSVNGKLWDEDAEGSVTELTDVLEPQIEVTGQTTVVLDATVGEPVTVTTERPAVRERVFLDVHRVDEPQEWFSGFGATVPGSAGVYATRTEPVTEGGFGLTAAFNLAAPTSTADEAPEYTYDLAYDQDEVVETLAFAATPENTTAVAVGYADLGPGVDVSSSRWGLPVGKEWVHLRGYSRPVAPGTSRTEYVTANEVTWRNTAVLSPRDGSDEVYINGVDHVYPPGEAVNALGGAVMSAKFSEHNRIGTWGDLLRLGLDAFVDSDGQHINSLDKPGKVRVWQDGTEIVDEDEIFFGLPIPVEGADYRVVLDAERAAPWWNRSTRESTEWTFHAEPGEPDPDGEPPFVRLPVLDVAYDVAGMDLANNAPRRTTATVTVGHQAGSTGGTVTGARLSWSPDDGATWRKATLRRTGAGVYTADLRVPKGTEHVSLRVEAKDKAGTTIKQTVIRAYGVR
ncbi:S8 family serine peptidase [Promicromonospora alba]|uniref:S8 family serine peptidase n=1 Tax=Promicromonospora alba TaxID=1616110 RepID=A0ABV9HHG7_9MICO